LGGVRGQMQYVIPFPDLDPEIFSVSFWGIGFALRWYALAYIVGILIGLGIVFALMRRPGLWPGDTVPMRPAEVEGLLTWIVLGVILGGRLGFVLFYQPGYYLDHPMEILAIWQGGMSFHGGLAGGVVALVLYAGATGCRCSRWPMPWRWPPRRAAAGPDREFHQWRVVGPADRPCPGRCLSRPAGAALPGGLGGTLRAPSLAALRGRA
jgi:prolipoprotein diacylglyceryl transferase